MHITEIRKEKQLRAVDMAAKLGISQGYYSNLEKGKRPFNGALLKKTAKILGVSEIKLRESAKLQLSDTLKLKSWMSNIKINGLPLIKAFRYYVETNGMQNEINNNDLLKMHIKQFIEKNIGFSVLVELSENKNLIEHLREGIGMKQ